MSFQYIQPEPEEKKKSPVNMQVVIVVVIGLVVVVCLIIGIVVALPRLSSLLSGSSGEAASGETVSYDIPTAREAYVPAVTLIRSQDAGAQLASATGAWTPVINRAQLGSGRTGWTFAFYLPSTEQMALVVVDRTDKPLVVSKEPWGTPPGLHDDQNWQIDSGGNSGMEAFLQTCGGTLEAEPDSRVHATLTTSTESQWLLWQYQLLSPGGVVLCEVSLDASSGQVR
ncbi:MAG: hypothetical protein JXB30_12115 [Anaerolineae bacterium]|nr:hypothetical protein [Anaerolineae bacterium]